LELVRLYNEATVAQRSDQDGWEQIQLSLRELARQCADLRPDLVHPFSNDELLVLITEKVPVDLPPDMGCVGHVEGAHDRTPQGVLAPVAERLDAIGTELAAMNAAASAAERREVGDPISARYMSSTCRTHPCRRKKTTNPVNARTPMRAWGQRTSKLMPQIGGR
jgi:hypothetical protein